VSGHQAELPPDLGSGVSDEFRQELSEEIVVPLDDLVFQQQLATVEAPSGRRVVPVSVIEEWRRDHPIHA
jgi:hypothetical protein